MKMRYFEAKKGRVEIIPMIDVMLFLLVFFIIITLQMIPDSGVPMQLPVSSQTQELPHPKIMVSVLADGTIKAKDQVMTTDQLTAFLQADGDPAKTELTIATDKATAFQHFMSVMDAARAAGVTDVGLAAQAGTASGQ
ncbi:MAG: ExbD/TolR family protein [Acidocella sp.]|uniref:ExbD/TolR family protein n=1 Tax=Acidocella sp. TaxID=50710 RepID=UPI003FC1108C